VWTPRAKWQERKGWQRVAIEVRGCAVRLLVKVAGCVSAAALGQAGVFFVLVVRGHHKRSKRGKSRAPSWVQAVADGKGGWQLPVSLELLLLKWWQRWELEVGFRWLRSGFGLGEKPCWGFDSGERCVACVGVWGVGVEWVSGVGRVDRWCALGGVSGACAVEFSGCVVERAL
jgi:hypothetical protein